MNRKAVQDAALPEGWRQFLLHELSSLKITNGIFNDPKKVGNGYKLVNVVNLYTEPYIKTDELKLLNAGKSEFEKFQLIKGDLLFTRSSLKLEGIAHCNIYQSNDENIIFECHTMRVRPNESLVLPKYLYFFCRSNAARRYFMGRAKTTTMTTIDQSGIGELPVPVPSLIEQSFIISLLETWDTAIEKTEALIAAKEKQFKWLLKKLISDQQANPAWRKVKLGDIFNHELMIEKGKMLTKEQMTMGDYPVVAGGQTYAAYHNECTHSTKTITISSSGAYAGFIWFHVYPIFATDCSVITVASGIIEYFYQAIKIKQSHIYSLQSGGAQPHIYAKDIATLNIMIPPLSEQKTIAHILKETQREICLFKQLVEHYYIQKRGLMQKLLTGEWSISTPLFPQFFERKSSKTT